MTRNSLSIVLVNLLVMAGAADAVETIDKSAKAPRFPFSADDARRYQEAYAKSSGLPVEWANDLGMKFVLIPPGSFLMGSPEKEPGRKRDETRHAVTLTRPFYLSRYETMVGQFRRFVETEKYVADGERNGGGHAHDSRAFCRWVTGRAPAKLPRPAIYDLPAEAQWEWACRAGSAARHWWGAKNDTSGKVANVGDRTLKRVHPKWPRTIMPMDDGHAFPAPVGNYRANGFGLHDMLGNVWEFCSTRAGPYSRGPVTDPRHLDPRRDDDG